MRPELRYTDSRSSFGKSSMYGGDKSWLWSADEAARRPLAEFRYHRQRQSLPYLGVCVCVSDPLSVLCAV
jgi:hypothetical protein